MLLIFVLIGVFLEGLHAFKVSWYLDVGNDARRLMFRLAHAHGTLLSILNIAFALSLEHLPGLSESRGLNASKSMKISSVLLPGGFFLGGFFIYDGDPGLGVFVVPLGAIALIYCVAIMAMSSRRTDP